MISSAKARFQSISPRKARMVVNLIRGRDAPIGHGPTYAVCKGSLVAIGQIEKGELRPVRVFNFGGFA